MTGDEVRAARKALGYRTQDDFAEALGLVGLNRRDTVRSWETGKRPIGGPAIRCIELLFRVRDLECELGINADRNTKLARTAGDTIDARTLMATSTRRFDPTPGTKKTGGD